MPRKPHILHVDDNDDDRALFQWAFIKSGIQGVLHSVGSAAEAMHYLNQSNKSPDTPRPKLIFLDLSLPRFDGLDLLELLRDHTSFRTIPIVVLSGSESHANQQRCRELGVQDYMVKPQTQQELAELIASLETLIVGSSSGLPAQK